VKVVNGYQITETQTIRSQDMRRFTVTKPGRDTPYIVSFQSRHSHGCSCIAGRNQKHCKHVTMCMQVVEHQRQAARA
jgi:hypothetical protein